MRKNFLFLAMAVFLAGFGFGGISMAGNDPETPSCATTTEEATSLHVAKITAGETTTSYCTLGDAISAAQGENTITITLLQDVNEDVTISAGKTIILDLKGKTLTNVNGNTITNYGTLTVINGTVDNTVHGKGAIVNNEGGTLTIGDGAIIERSKETGVDAYTSGGNSYYTIHNKGTMTVLEGALIQNNGKYSSCIVNGYPKGAISSTAETSLTIEGGTIEGGVNSVKNDERGVLVVNGGTIINDGGAGIMNWHKGTINNVTVNAVYAFSVGKYGDTADGVLEINGGDYTASSEIFAEGQYSENGINVTIKDGSFKGSFGLNNDDITYTIDGGKYSDKPEGEYIVPTHKYLAEQEDGTYQLAHQTEISTININVTAPVKDGAPITPTTDTEGITFDIDNIKWYEGELTEPMGTDAKYLKDKAYKVVIPYTVAASHYLADSYAVTPTTGTEDHATAGQITITFGADAVAEGYTIKFVNHDGTELKTYTVAVNETPVYDGVTPTKASDSSYTYSFKGWTPEIVAATDNATYTAEFTANSKPSYSGGGGSSSGGGGSSKSSTKATDNKGSVNNATGTNEALTGDNNTEENNNEEDNTPMTLGEAIALFGDEQIDAYQWALENGITTMDTVEKARLDQPLTRAELAKMMVVYMQKVLKAEPVVTGEVKYLDVDESLGDLAGYIQLAYQYQIMGINADGTSLENFNPNGVVTRGEYATVFSRVLFGSVFNKEGADFYTNHLEALKEAGILKDTTPTMQEIRGWVMLMMYRSSQNSEEIQKVAAAVDEAAAPAEENNEEGNKEEAAAENAETETPAENTEGEPTTGDVVEAPAENAEATTGDVAETPAEEASN